MKKIILIVTGSIAAPKGVLLRDLLERNGYQVEFIMTENAFYFTEETPPRVITDIFEHDFYDKTIPSRHIAIAKDANLVVVYPASADFIGKIANGLCNDLGSLVYLASDCPKIVQPAMNTKMYLSRPVQRNLDLLREDGAFIVEPASGMLACQTVGPGRAQEAIFMIDIIKRQLNAKDGKELI